MSMDKLFDGSDAHLLPGGGLTGERIVELWHKNKGVLLPFVRDIEAEVLAKQAKAEPVAYCVRYANTGQIGIVELTLDALADFAESDVLPLYLHPAPAPEGMVIDVDWLSNVIRAANGENKLGAGALAEKIVEAIAKAEKDGKNRYRVTDDGLLELATNLPTN